jgi:hypothetical protein
MSVQYIADSETDAKSECYAVHDRLYAALNYISCGDSMLRGVMMSGEVLDGVLTFTVTYNVFVRRVPEVEPMETLTVENTA